MTLRDIYLKVHDRAPEPLRPLVRGAATIVRQVRRLVRRTGVAAARAAAAATRPLIRTIRRTEPGRRFLDSAQRSQLVVPFVTAWRRLRPVVVPVEGGFVLVDALGVSAGEAVRAVPHGMRSRAVVITDDPGVGPIRAAGLLYEYVPSSVAADPGLRSARIAHFERAYNTGKPVRPSAVATD